MKKLKEQKSHSAHTYNEENNPNFDESNVFFSDSFETYDRVIEMSGYDENSRQKARLNFKRYKTMNFEINTVPIKL